MTRGKLPSAIALFPASTGTVTRIIVRIVASSSVVVFVVVVFVVVVVVGARSRRFRCAACSGTGDGWDRIEGAGAGLLDGPAPLAWLWGRKEVGGTPRAQTRCRSRTRFQLRAGGIPHLLPLPVAYVRSAPR